MKILDMEFEKICDELQGLSTKLLDLLPDPALSPLERIERLSRVQYNTIKESSNHKTARVKLFEIDRKLSEIIPNNELNNYQKIDYLVSKLNKLVPINTNKIFQKLEIIGDNRALDNGGVPSIYWKKNRSEEQYLTFIDNKTNKYHMENDLKKEWKNIIQKDIKHLDSDYIEINKEWKILCGRVLPKDLEENFPINSSHEIYIPSYEEKIKLKAALKYLYDNYTNEIEELKNYFKIIFWCKLKNDSKEDTITSLTVPKIPNASFISKKALYHNPPEFIHSKDVEINILAENIYHEMIHNKLNNLIYYKKFFKSNYDRKELTGQFKINAWESYKDWEWELDRVVHATTVFVHLIKFRKQELNNSYVFSNLKYKDAFSNKTYEEGIYKLIETVDMFFKLIDEKMEFFTENGVVFITNLKAMFNKVN